MKMKRLLNSILKIILVPCLIIIIWSLISVFKLTNSLFVPSPLEVIHSLFSLIVSGEIYIHLFFTLYRALFGFLLAVLIAVPLGIVIGFSVTIYRHMEFSIDFIRSIPATALFPLFMISLGIGNKSKIAIIAFSCGFVMLVNTMYGVWNTRKARVLLAKTLRVTPFQMLLKIVFPDSLPYIYAGLRNAISLALILAVVTEMFIGTKEGLGFLIYNAKITYEISQMYSVIILTGLLGYLSNKVIIFTEKKIIHWSGK